MIFNLLKKCNILTFLGITFSVIGICYCYKNMTDFAVVMIILGGICDGLDGPIARKINKGDNIYGVELDSLADIICSGVLPITICLSLGYNSWINTTIYAVFILCGIIRLAYYNVNSTDKNYFEGVPITFSTILIPLIYLAIKNEISMMIALVCLSMLFVSGIKVKKPSMKLKIILSIAGIALISTILLLNI